MATSRMLAPILPFLTDAMYLNLVTSIDPAAPDSVHLTRWPEGRNSLGTVTSGWSRRSRSPAEPVELVRGCAAEAGIKTRQPLARGWLALPGDGDGTSLAAQGLIDIDRARGQPQGRDTHPR